MHIFNIICLCLFFVCVLFTQATIESDALFLKQCGHKKLNIYSVCGENFLGAKIITVIIFDGITFVLVQIAHVTQKFSIIGTDYLAGII